MIGSGLETIHRGGAHGEGHCCIFKMGKEKAGSSEGIKEKFTGKGNPCPKASKKKDKLSRGRGAELGIFRGKKAR